MSTQISLEKFEEIYNKTYKTTLKYIVLHCSNLEDVNDIIQDTYVELYNNIKRKKQIILENEQGFIIGIANHIIKKYYRKIYKNKNDISILNDNEEIEINSEQDLEMQFITKENVEKVWEYVNKKDAKIAKVFYLYYGLDMKIVDIAEALEITQSATKNYIYRTIRELRSIFDKECDEDAK